MKNWEFVGWAPVRSVTGAFLAIVTLGILDQLLEAFVENRWWPLREAPRLRAFFLYGVAVYAWFRVFMRRKGGSNGSA